MKNKLKRKRKILAQMGPAKAVRLHMAQRRCGDCQACCVVMAVDEIGKPEGTPCEHQCRKGCGIYPKRPGNCRGFNCLWRMGLGQISERPDKTGLLFDVSRSESGMRQVLVAREAHPGAFEESKDILDRLALQEGHIIILVSGDERNIIGPPDKLLEYVREIGYGH